MRVRLRVRVRIFEARVVHQLTRYGDDTLPTPETQSLHAHFCKCIGVDVAEGMLAKYRATAGELGLSEQRMMAVQGDLLAERTDHLTTEPRLSDEELAGFDLVAICMALHHASDVELATRRLAERLRPGGVLLIIDWAGQADWHAHPAAHTVSHESFSEEQIVSLFEQAGCCQPSFVLASEPSDVPPARSGKMQLFFARAKKK